MLYLLKPKTLKKLCYEEIINLNLNILDEVILSGGAINSPQLLMLSGVGDSKHLEEVGITPVHHLPGVGQNLQDHLEVYMVQGCRKPVSLLADQKGLRMIKVGVQWFLNRTGSASSTHLETGEIKYHQILKTHR